MDDVVDFVAEVEDGWWKGTYKVQIFGEGQKFLVAFKGKGTLFWMTPYPLFTCLKVSK